MVYIKRITIQGFKSFGAKRVVIKPEKGFVVITGPNGGGKSNVLDAIKFCLGELSINALRVGKLSDLIHENDGRRLSQATVTLLLDNSDRALPIETDEVTVSRTISSSGESTYRVNGKLVSRNELQSILAAANIRASGFNMITQGAVLSIAEKTPDELRKIIDEVAGVSEFDRRKSEALRELEVAEKNVAIARAGLNELKDRVKQLELERNRNLRSQLASRFLSQLKRQRILEELSELDEKSLSLEREESLLMAMRSQVSAQVERLSKMRQERLARSRDIDAELAEIQRRVNSLRLESQRGGSSLDSIRSSIRSEGSRYIRLKRDTSELLRRASALKSETFTLERDVMDAEREYSEHVKVLAGLESQLKGLLERRSKMLATLQNWRKSLAILESKRSSLMKELSQIEARLALAESELMAKESALEETRSKKLRTEDDLAKSRDLLAEINSNIPQLEKEINKVRHRLRFLEELSDEARKRAEDVMRLKAEVEGRLGILNGEEKPSPSDSPVISNLPVMKLKDLLKTSSEMSDELKSIISAQLDALIVEKESLAFAISEMAAKRGRSLEVLSLESEDGENCAGEGCLACRLAENNAQLKRALHSLFPGYVLDETDRIRSGRPTITRDGIRYDGRSVFRVTPSPGLRRRYESLLSSLEVALNEVQEFRGECEAELTRMKRELSILEEQLMNFTQRRRGIESIIQGHSRKITELIEEEKRTVCEIESLKNLLSNLSNERERLLTLLNELKTQPGEEPEAPDFHDQLEEINSQIGLIQRRVGEEVTVMQAIKQRLEAARKRLSEALNDINRLERESERLEIECEQSKAKLADLARLYLESWRRALVRDIELKDLLTKESELLNVREQISEELADIESRLEEERSKLLSIESQTKSLAVAKVELSMMRNSLIERLSSMSGPPIEDLSHLPPDFLDLIRRELETELSTIGMVNQLAGIQYSELIIEYKGRSKNVTLLEQERSKILQLIEVLDAEKLEVFMKTFTRISEGFGRYFTALTGGTGWLEFSDPENPVESGVEMYVAFPGKSPKPSRSISGGEKSVAAVALLMAFQGLTPADFIIMDEVDAHMDANYSKNLAMLLKEFSSKTQVITVSLKDVIAERADQLIGVYNQGGESRIVVTRLEDKQS